MATKIFDYAVIWGGKIVPPHTPIEVEEATTEKSAAVDKPKKGAKKNDNRGTNEA